MQHLRSIASQRSVAASEPVTTYKGAKKGDATESRKRDSTRAIKYLDKKACTGLQSVHLGGCSSVL